MIRGSRSRTPVIRICASALKAWWDDDALRLGAALAYYTLFAIAPVLLVATGIAGLVFNSDAVRAEIVNQLDRLVGREGAHAVQSLLDGASQRRAGILATTIGSVALALASTGAFLELQAALNTIWRVKSNPAAHLKAFLLDRLRSFGLVVAIGFLLMVSLAVTAALAAFSAWLSPHSSSVPLVWTGIQVLISLIGTTALFALLYRVLPDVHLGWRDVTTGAFVTAVLFTLGQQLIGLYLGQSSMASSYGAAGSVMILCCGCTTRARFCCSVPSSRACTRSTAARPSNRTYSRNQPTHSQTTPETDSAPSRQRARPRECCVS
jgi:membrane protein